MRKSLLTRATFGFALAAIMLTGAYASAAAITWVTPATDVDTSLLTDFSTAGTFFDSAMIKSNNDLNFLSSPNNIPMHRRDGSDVTNPYTFIGSGITLSVTSGAIGFGEQVTAGFTTNDYMRMLAQGTYGGGDRDLTISGLTFNKQYQVQIWTPYWNQEGATTIFAAGNSVTLNVGYVTGGDTLVTQPQFSIGTFTADATTQVINWTSFTGDAFFGAIQVRDLTPTPEPSAVILLGFGSVGMLRFVRRRQKQQFADQAAK